MAPEAEIGWFDLDDKTKMVEAIMRAENLKWLSSIYAGVDGFPLDMMAERGIVFTNGVGINAITIAEYVVMGMLNVAKGYREVVRAQDRHEWLAIRPARLNSPAARRLCSAMAPSASGLTGC
jgi:phosphoglycerate dehydrogenase-like enzyme